jgi:hypothetical protein
LFSVKARKLIRFNKSENAKGMWKSIFASCHTGSEACATKTIVNRECDTMILGSW